MLKLWEMRSTPSLPFLPGLLWPEMVAPNKALSMGYKELTTYLCKTEMFELEPFD